MIQRIQTLYLLISVICLGIVSSGITIYRIDMGSIDPKSSINPQAFFNVFGYEYPSFGIIKESQTFIPFFVITAVIIFLQVWAIFLFKNLKLQLRIVNFSLIIYLISVGFTVASPFVDSVNSDVMPGYKWIYSIGFFILVFGLPFVFLANRAIKKDKNLLDSLNRLR